MADHPQNPTQNPGQQQGEEPREGGSRRQDEDLSQGSETLDDALEEDKRDHSDTGRGKRGVLDK